MVEEDVYIPVVKQQLLDTNFPPRGFLLLQNPDFPCFEIVQYAENIHSNKAPPLRLPFHGVSLSSPQLESKPYFHGQTFSPHQPFLRPGTSLYKATN